MPLFVPFRLLPIVCMLSVVAFLIGIEFQLCLAGEADAPKYQFPKRPNIVLMVADDLGAVDLACYGSDLHETPHLDRFARQSIFFTNAYAAGSICTPTRASILTGKTPAKLHMTIWREWALEPPESDQNRKVVPPKSISNLPLEEYTLAEALQDEGYATVHIGKWHLGVERYFPQFHGFDIQLGGNEWGCPTTFFHPFYKGDPKHSSSRRIRPLDKLGKPGEYLTDRITTEALSIVDQVKHNPFFLHINWWNPHFPIEAPQPLVDKYSKKVRPELKHQNETYAGMIEILDNNFQRVIEHFRKNGLAENTVFIFTSDNGGSVHKHNGRSMTNNFPFRSGKGALYEGGTRVPLLIYWPGVTPQSGAVCDEMVSTIDFYPTILELVGAKGSEQQNRDMEGISFASLLHAPDTKLDRNTLYWHYPHYYPTTGPVSSIREDNWKLVYYYKTGGNVAELYDLKEDKGESKNLAAQEPQLTKRLTEKLLAMLNESNARLPTIRD